MRIPSSVIVTFLLVGCSVEGSLHDARKTIIDGPAREGAEVIRVPAPHDDRTEPAIDPLPKTPDAPPNDSSEQTPPQPDQAPATSWSRYEPDSDFHNMFGGVFWRIHNGFLEVRDAPRPTGSLTLVAQCLQTYGASFDKWSAALKIKVAQLYATAVTESGCVNQSGSSDGLSSGIMQVTGTTCVEVMQKAGKNVTANGCKSMMHANPDFSVEVASRYMSDPYQIGLNQFTPVNGTRSDLGPALDPPKVAAAYNKGTLKETSANRWRMMVTADHLDRYVNAYNAFVEYTKKAPRGLTPLTSAHFDLAPNPALPESVPALADLRTYDSVAREGNAVFVGDPRSKRGDFYYWIKGRWRAASESW